MLLKLLPRGLRCRGLRRSLQQARFLSYSQLKHSSPSSNSENNPPLCHKLTQRGLVRLAGPDASPFLQGLITNDMSCLHGDCEVHAMYALMLNVQGRVMHDLLLYNIEKSASAPPVILVECDISSVADFIKVLYRYKIRKKIDISQVSDEYASWSVFPSKLFSVSHATPTPTPTSSDPKLCSSILEDQYRIKVNPSDAIVTNDPDPRIRSFARRLVLKADCNACDVVVGGETPPSPSSYDERRYELGLAEGILDMPPGASIPLENNAVFMNGVSFQKGCYIGQELTARTHHTGVIRKRLMPLRLNSSSYQAQPGDKVETEAGKNVGKFRNAVNEHGLALLRIKDAVGQSKLLIKNENGDVVGEGHTWIPHWWPREADGIVKSVLEQQAGKVAKDSTTEGKV